MGKIALFTTVTKSYLPFARVLMQSVKQVHPEFARFVLLVDQPQGFFTPEDEDFTIEYSAALDIPHRPVFHFKYNVLELSTALKPYYIEHLFAKHDFSAIIFLDPDILLYDDLSPVLDALEHNNIVLTPHLTAPLDDGNLPSEFEILISGSYNTGFIALSRSAETSRFLRWWQQKLFNDGIADTAKNLFVDQRWIDLVPGMFAGVATLRDPGLNVAYWNIPHRRIEARDGRYLSNEAPLRFFHFSGYRAENPQIFSKYDNRYRSGLSEPLRGLVEDYRERLIAHGYMHCKDWPYAYGYFPDGSRIPDICRRIVRDDIALQATVAAEASDQVGDTIITHLNAPIDEAGPGMVLITRLAHEIYLRREDVIGFFPQLVGATRSRFASWFVDDAARQYRLPAVFVEPVLESLDRTSWHREAPERWPGHDAMLVRSDTLHAQMRTILQNRDAMIASMEEMRARHERFEAWSRAVFEPQ